jgi:ketosteroid isomerase-like protein
MRHAALTALSALLLFSGAAYSQDLRLEPSSPESVLISNTAAKADKALTTEEISKLIEDTNVILGDKNGGFCSASFIDVDRRLLQTAAHCTEQAYEDVKKEFVDPKTGEVSERTVREYLDLEIWHNIVKDYKVVSAQHFVVTKLAENRSDDIAILQVRDAAYRPKAAIKFVPASRKLRQGEVVFALANPAIEFDNTLTQGIISSTERTVTIQGLKQEYFQHSAAQFGGSSGGAIINEQGQLIGVISAGVRGAAIGFAVPIEKVKKMLRGLGFADVFEPKKVVAAPVSSRKDDQ